MDQKNNNPKLDNILRPRELDLVSNKSMSVMDCTDKKSKLENSVITEL